MSKNAYKSKICSGFIFFSEYVKVTITEINNRVKRQARSGTTTPNPLPPNNSSSGNSFGSRLLPDLLHISFRLGDKDVHMDLKKRPIRNTPVPMYTSFSDKSLRLHHLSSIKVSFVWNKVLNIVKSKHLNERTI